MKRFELIKTDILMLYDTIEDDLNRYLCRTHHLNVLYQLEKLTDNELLYVAGLLHDIALYFGLEGNHAQNSSAYATDFLKRYSCFSTQEKQLICDCIALHSDKDHVHFHEAELLKQADKSAHAFEKPVFRS